MAGAGGLAGEGGGKLNRWANGEHKILVGPPMACTPTPLPHCKREPQERLYIALDDGFDFSWRMEDVAWVKEWYRQGSGIKRIASRLNRDPDEVAVLIMDLARKGELGEKAS